MATEKEQSLQKRLELVPENLLRGGLIVGMEQTIQGSLLSVTGGVLERITRERTEIPPKFRLPERAVYLLDPNQRRLVMISNRENIGRGPERAGLFAEVMELDEEGNPIYMLSNSEVSLSTDSYQIVKVGPNDHRLPPSHINIVEEEDLEKEKEEQKRKERFISWNSYIANLQIWMNSLTLGPQESLGDFISKYHTLKQQQEGRIIERVGHYFPKGWQGFSENIAPINWIISDDRNKEMLLRASFAAGLYPVFMDMKDLLKKYDELSGSFKNEPSYYKDIFRIDLWWSAASHLSTVDKDILNKYLPAVITLDIPAAHRMEGEMGLGTKKNLSLDDLKRIQAWIQLTNYVREISPVFSFVDLWGSWLEGKPTREGAGRYGLPCHEDTYKGLLFKLKADLLLTTFLRGGAPLTK